jgi:hypothetical protein
MMEKIQMLKVEAQPTIKIDQTKGILKYGVKNDFAENVISAVTESPTGMAFLSTYQRFLQGNGIEDTAQAFTNVGYENGRPVFFDNFNEKLTTDLTWFDGIAIRVLYNPMFQPVRYNHMNFDEMRLGVPDEKGNVNTILHNPYWTGRFYKAENTSYYYPFDPRPEVVMAQMKHAEENGREYMGQVYYKIMEKPGFRTYPIPYYYPAIKTFITDAGISEFHKNNVENNFVLSNILNVVGNEFDPVFNADGETVTTQGELLRRQIESKQGVQTGGGVMINWAQNKENFAEFAAFPTNANDNTFNSLQELIIEKIAYSTMVPPILAGVQTAGKLGASNEIANSVVLLNQKTQKHRMFLQETYRELLPLMFKGIEPPKIEMLSPKDFYEQQGI